MCTIKKLIVMVMTAMLILPAASVSASTQSATNQTIESVSTVTYATYFVRIQNKWKGNYLYEDSIGKVRYGFTSINDQTSQWLIEDAPGGAGYKRIKNRFTGHYVTMAQVNARRDALTSENIQTSTIKDQWIIQDASRVGYKTIRSAATIESNNFIHEEDQIGFAEVSADIGADWESPQWRFETAADSLPVRIVAKKGGSSNYLYEDADGIIEYGKVPANDPKSHWFIDVQTDNADGSKVVRLKNRATGHYITQGIFWAAIQGLELDNADTSEWTMSANAADPGWINFNNLNMPNYILNDGFDDTNIRSNDWRDANSDDSKWKIEAAADVNPVRIVNYTTADIGTAYLNEDSQGIVKAGALSSTSAYLWLVEDSNGKKRFKNASTGHYISSQNSVQPTDPLQSLNLQSAAASDQWNLANSTIYDDYITIQSASQAANHINAQPQSDFAQSSAVDPNSNPAQWLFEDPNVVPGAIQYVQIENEWQSMFLYEDTDGSLKYGNAKPDDQRAQWLVKKFEGRKQIQNRATGHYIQNQGFVNGRIQVTNVLSGQGDFSKWVIEDLGGTKLIHSIADTNSDVNHQKFIHLQSLTKYAEYSEINRNFGSPHWKFITVADAALTNVRIKNKFNGNYLYEDNGVVKDGALPASNTTSQWFLENAGDKIVRLKNIATGHYISIDAESGTFLTDPVGARDVANQNTNRWRLIAAGDYTEFMSDWSTTLLYVKDPNDGNLYTDYNHTGSDLSQWTMEAAPIAPDVLPQGNIRIKNRQNGQYLYENKNNVVLYGTPDSKDASSHWTIQTVNGIQVIQNRQTGNYVSIANLQSYLESLPSANAAGTPADQWNIEKVPSGNFYLIRSNLTEHTDDYVNVHNSAGFAEYGLYSDTLGTLQWAFETASADTVVSNADPVNTNTKTPILDDTNYVRILNKATKQYLYEKAGNAVSGNVDPKDQTGQWLSEDYNGRKLLKNRATGHYLNVEEADSGLKIATSYEKLGSQWLISDYAGYKTVESAQKANQFIFQSNSNSNAQFGAIGQQTGNAQWILEKVIRDVTYEAENAFMSGGSTISAGIKNFTGQGYVDNFTNIGANVTFTVNAQAADDYDIIVSYSSPKKAKAKLGVYVNGLQDKKSLKLDSQDDDNSWNNEDLELSLRAGINTISLQNDNGISGALAIDSITVRKSINKDYRGATLPYVSYEAEQGTTNATIIGPDRTYLHIASEASGRKAVKLDHTGQYVEFTLAKPTNSIVVRYAIPDTAQGGGSGATLGLYVNGVHRTDLTLTSKYSWIYGSFPGSNDPAQGSARRFFDETHALIGDIPAGATIRLQKDAANSADYYIVDTIETEVVAPADSKPDGFVSVTDFGAVANDGISDTAAFKAAMTKAKANNTGVWFPKGGFDISSELLHIDSVTIRGAGMWQTTLIGAKFYGEGGKIQVSDLMIDGGVTERHDALNENAFEGAFGPGSVIQNVWIEHVKVGLWITRSVNNGASADSLYIEGLRVRNTFADGMNFAVATKNTMVEQTQVRYSGDDGIAMWSPSQTTDKFGAPIENLSPSENDTARFNTVQLPWLANNFALFGGKNNKVQDNVAIDTIGLGSGITVATRFNPIPFSGTTIVQRNTLIRTGSRDKGLGLDLGAIWLYAADKDINADIQIKDNTAIDSSLQGLSIQGNFSINKVSFENDVIDRTGTWGIDAASGVSGSIDFNNVIIRNAIVGDQSNSAGANFTKRLLNEGFASTVKIFGVTIGATANGPFVMNGGSTATLQATLLSDNSNVTAQTTFVIQDPQVAFISSDGKITANHAGFTIIDAVFGANHRLYTLEVK